MNVEALLIPERRAIAERHTIIKALVGSKLHGLNLEGTDDTDEMGVFIEPPEYVVGLRSLENVIARTQPEGVPSGPGDVDLALYSLRKFVRLALSGNPTILLMFFVPEDKCSERRRIGRELQEMAPLFIAKTVAAPFLGYLTAQKQRLTGERGGRALRKHLPEGMAQYDTKYAMHMLRLGFQGVEILETGTITLPIPDPDRSYMMAVRRGEVDLGDVLTRCGMLEKRIEDLSHSSFLRDRPDQERIEEWMIRTYLRHEGWL